MWLRVTASKTTVLDKSRAVISYYTSDDVNVKQWLAHIYARSVRRIGSEVGPAQVISV